MIVSEVSFYDEDEGRRGLIICVKDGDIIKQLEFLDGESEDNNIFRNFKDVKSIASLIKIGYEAGKRGDPIFFRSVEVNDLEDFLVEAV